MKFQIPLTVLGSRLGMHTSSRFGKAWGMWSSLKRSVRSGQRLHRAQAEARETSIVLILTILERKVTTRRNGSLKKCPEEKCWFSADQYAQTGQSLFELVP